MTARSTKPFPRLSAPLLRGNWSEFQSDRLGLFMRVTRECGEVGSFRLGPLSVLLVNSVKMLNTILVEESANFSSAPFAKSFIALTGETALPATHGEYHRKLRRIMAPAFQPRRLIDYCDQMAALADEAQRAVPDNAEVDMISVTSGLTRDILARCVFLMDFKQEEKFLISLRLVAQYVADTIANPIQFPLSVPTARNRRVSAAIAYMRGRAQDIIARGRDREDLGDVLSMLLRARDDDGTGLTEIELLDQTITLYMAGQETSANSLSWLWLLLARNPDIQARLHSELDTVLQGRLPTHADLAQLPYSLQVLKETMRLCPSIHLFAREPLEDMEVDGYLLRKGQFIFISPYTLHRHPEYFPNPEQMDPERFSLQNERKLPRGAYLPFGTGPHVCIGQHFAMLEMQMAMIRICQNLHFSPMSDQPVGVRTASTLAPVPFTLKVRRREKSLAMLA